MYERSTSATFNIANAQMFSELKTSSALFVYKTSENEFMPRPLRNNRRKPPNMPDLGGIEIDTIPEKFKKEAREREQREQEATRESD